MDIQQLLNYMQHMRISQIDPKGKGATGMKPDTRRSHKFSSVNLTLEVRKGDMTKEQVDAIVNAANCHLNHISGLAGAISRAGGPSIQRESTAYVRSHRELKEGDVVVTTSGSLEESQGIKKVFHAVGPIFPFHSDHRSIEHVELKEDKELYMCIWNALKEAEVRMFKSIAFPAVSSGIFGYPKDRTARILFNAVDDFVKQRKRNDDREKVEAFTDSLEYIAFTNFDDLTVEVFEEEFDKRNYIDEEVHIEEKNEDKPIQLAGQTEDVGQGEELLEKDNGESSTTVQ
uniref:Macro domain-containing protein n=1 Tax=Percolomonas cosmopolitus TaxID=63605 RepID=A0A7S1PFT8_9EUKA